MRNILLETSALDWGKISPSIFGSLFQSVMNPEQRRNLGAHYTSERNILKLIKPLFLDDLRAEFEKVQTSKPKLREFHQKLAKLKFLDPACGSGNFLIIAYRELRQLELEILRILYDDQLATSIESYIFLDVDQFYGIEYDEFASKIAEVAMWLIDHQMNMKISVEFGQYFARLPLKKSPKIVNGNALRIDWDTLVEGSYLDLLATRTNIIQVNEPLPHYETLNVYSKSVNFTKGELPKQDDKWHISPKGKVDYILGNPPFVGKQLQSKEQKKDMNLIFAAVNGAGVLDYVTAWYIKAAQYISGTKIKAAFVSTNSITQGEQVGILWNELLNKYKLKIHFAHRTFNWSNEAKNNAAVFVVIIGFANYEIKNKRLFEYESKNSEPHEILANNINPYLVNAVDLLILKRSKPICNVPQMLYGNKLVDGGYYLFNDFEKSEFIRNEPIAEKIFRPILSGDEYINGKNRWVLYLKEIKPNEINKLYLIKGRIESVQNYRKLSTKKQTRDTALTPTLFAEQRQPESNFLLIPRTSSENRAYIPMGFFDKYYIVNDSCTTLPNATIYNFGILMSKMHMTWTKYTCGRLKSDFRYSNVLVYNNFPWPQNPSKKNKNAVEEKAQKVLDVRAEFKINSLAVLYNPLSMPPKLVKVHQELDNAVDLCYRPQVFTNENTRIEYLFDLYNQYTMPLIKVSKKNRKK